MRDKILDHMGNNLKAKEKGSLQEISPSHYRIRLAPDLEQFEFAGEVEITFNAKSPVETIRLNILDIEIFSCRLIRNEKIIDCQFLVHPEKEELGITLPEVMSSEIRVAIGYQGKINDLMAGFYRSKYVVEGQTKYIAVTQFEESDARRAFPCMDHPSKKAVFDITLDIDPHLTAVSNGDILKEEILDNGKKRVVFESTPKMSTYLVFFGVGEFDITKDEIDPRVRAVTLPGMKAHAGYGLAFGRKSLQFSESYYGVDYPMSKMDLIAIPDFAFGAMENWGAITFRENLLLHYPEMTSATGEERICEVIAHEIAHQWFGNLVTPDDWKYLWLNESFATYFGYGVVDHFYPEWEIWSRFLINMTATAMTRDALQNTFPIEIPGGEHVVINSSTAPIIYNKGGSVLRQIYGYIGKDNFQKGLRHYLKTHAYECAASRHLWEAFENAADKPVTEMMKSWIEQPGFPVISAKKDNNRLILTQRRFSYLPDHSGQIWKIPVLMDLYDENGKFDALLVEINEKQKEVELPEKTVAYKINAGQTGFYRAKYENAPDLKALSEKVSKKILSEEDRWGLQSDLYHLCLSGEYLFDEYLAFIKNYEKETEFLPLTAIAENLSHAHQALSPDHRNAIETLAAPWYERILDRIGFEPAEEEKHTIAVLREQLLWDAVRFKVEKAEKFASGQFHALTAGRTVHPDIIKSIMLSGAWNGEGQTFKWFTDRFLTSGIEQDRINILTALGGFRSERDIDAVLRFVLDAVPARNKFIPVVAFSANSYAAQSLWKWYTSKLDIIEAQFHPLLYERVVGAVIGACGMEAADEVKDFFAGYLKKTAKASDVIRLSLERLEINLRFREINSK